MSARRAWMAAIRGFVEYPVPIGGNRMELLEKSPRHVVDGTNIDAPFCKMLEACDVRARDDDGAK